MREDQSSKTENEQQDLMHTDANQHDSTINRANKKVVHLTTVHHPFDPRIYHKECLSLKEAGYNVTLLAQPDPKTGETSDQITHIPLKTYQSKFKRIFLAPWKAYKIAKRIDADIYHF